MEDMGRQPGLLGAVLLHRSPRKWPRRRLAGRLLESEPSTGMPVQYLERPVAQARETVKLGTGFCHVADWQLPPHRSCPVPRNVTSARLIFGELFTEEHSEARPMVH